MAGLDDILRSWQKTNTAFDIHKRLKSAGINTLAEQIRDRGVAMAAKQSTFDTIAKSAMYKPKYDFFYFNSVSDWLQKTSLHQQIIPKPFESNFYKAVTSQQTILNNLYSVNNSLAIATKNIERANVLYRATGSLASSIFYETLKHKDWSNFNTLTPYYEKVAEITETIREEQTVTNETLQRFEAILVEVKSQLDVVVTKDKKAFLKAFYNLLNLIGFLIGVYCLYLTTSDMSNNEAVKQINNKIDQIQKENKEATERIIHQVVQVKEEVEKHFDSLFNNNLKVKSRITCPIRNKPISNSGVISILRKDNLISIIDSCKKYYLIMYKKETEEYPITGWVLKKHTVSK